MSRTQLSIIIPVFNKWELTAQCLQSLSEHTPGDDYEVIVVDNASSDETAALLPDLGRGLFGERFTRIRFEENRNFAGGCNAGAERAKAPLLFFLNNDTILTPNWLPPLTKRLSSDPALGMVGPLLLYEDGRVQHLGVAVNATGFIHLYRFFPGDHPVVKKTRHFQALTAAALMVSKDLFFQAGAFHEGYQNGFEDVELSLRMREMGKRLSCVPESVIYHLESQSPGRSAKDMANAKLLQNRCGDMPYVDIHHHALADGFAVTWDSGTAFLVHLKPEEDAELTRQAMSMDAPEALGLLRQNPLWRNGYDLLASALENAGLFEPAIALRREALRFFLAVPEWLALLRCGRMAGDKAAMREAENAIQKRLSVNQDKRLAAFRLRRLLRTAERNNDGFLAGLLQADLDNLLE